MAAINGGSGTDYQTYELDPAEADRWVFFDVEPSKDDFIKYLSGEQTVFDINNVFDEVSCKTRVPQVIIDFLEQFPQYIEHGSEFLVNRIYPSRRSWFRFGKVLQRSKYFCNPDKDGTFNKELLILCNAFVGEDAATKFVSYYSNYLDMMHVNFHLSKEELVSLLKTMSLGTRIFVMQNLFLSKKVEQAILDKNYKENVLAMFDEVIGSEEKSFFINCMLSSKNDELIQCLAEHDSVSAFLLVYAKEAKEKYETIKRN
jgi:hypothetical protein